VDSSASEKIKLIEEVNHALEHKPFHPESDAHRQFLQNLLEKMERLALEFDFSQEIRTVKNQISAEN
jgi:hypothetical protein